MTQNPYSAPTSRVADAGASDPGLDLQAVARAQRMVLFSVLASLVSNGLLRATDISPLLSLPTVLAVAIFSIWCVHRLCQALHTRSLGWILAMFLPLLNLICLVILNQRATSVLKAHGIAVGLMGAKL
ncbi:MAG TPA: hypothetical protein VFT46_11295 [Holophagaceae bacterium]|nr:hypothetical protein [Holophagaceae bacterium]